PLPQPALRARDRGRRAAGVERARSPCIRGGGRRRPLGHLHVPPGHEHLPARAPRATVHAWRLPRAVRPLPRRRAAHGPRERRRGDAPPRRPARPRAVRGLPRGRPHPDHLTGHVLALLVRAGRVPRDVPPGTGVGAPRAHVPAAADAGAPPARALRPPLPAIHGARGRALVVDARAFALPAAAVHGLLPDRERRGAERRRADRRVSRRRAAAAADRPRARGRARVLIDRRVDPRDLSASPAADLPRLGLRPAAPAPPPRRGRVRALPRPGPPGPMSLRSKLTLMFLGALQVTFFTAIGTFWALQSWQLVADDLTMIH